MFNNFTMAKPIPYPNTNVWGEHSLYNERVPPGILYIRKYANYLKKKGIFMNSYEYDTVFFTSLKDLQLTLH